MGRAICKVYLISKPNQPARKEAYVPTAKQEKQRACYPNIYPVTEDTYKLLCNVQAHNSCFWKF